MASEAQAHPTSEHHLECWTMNGSESEPKGLRIVKTNISCLFSFQTIRVNSAGQIVEEKRLTRNYFRETLRGGGGKSIDIDMMVVPAGKFWMGSPESEKDRHKDESPQHLVTVPTFFMSQTQVTQAQWRAIASLPQEGKKLEPDPSNFKGEDLPVEWVSWQDAIEFCARLSRHTGRNYRLPSEAEWEYACRAIQSPEQLSTGADQKPAWFKNGAFWVTKQDKSSHCSDNDLQYKNIKAQANLSSALKSLKLQQFQPMGMCLSHHQLGGTLANPFRTATSHESPMVQKEAQ